MSDDANAKPAMNEDQILAYVHGKRLDLVNAMTKTGIPEEKGDKMVLLTALSDMSRDAMSNKRIKSEEKIATGNSANVQLAAQILNMVNPQAMRAARIEGQSSRKELPVLGMDVERPVLLEGETSTAIATETFNQFSARAGLDGVNPSKVSGSGSDEPSASDTMSD